MTSPRLLSFTFHDVVENDPDASGFPGPGPARYKMSWPRFEEHLRALQGATGEVRPSLATSIETATGAWALTFDDGGCSALEIGRVLAERGWVAHFFVTVDRIGDPGFLDVEGIRALVAMGHLVGSHSCSHPSRMNRCSPDQLLDEWGRSLRVLSEMLDEEVETASIPGGGYHARVASAAESVGIRYLFTSEPRVTTWTVGRCLLFGRFVVHDTTESSRVAALANGKLAPRAVDYVLWNTRKAAKAVGGEAYMSARRLILARRR